MNPTTGSNSDASSSSSRCRDLLLRLASSVSASASASALDKNQELNISKIFDEILSLYSKSVFDGGGGTLTAPTCQHQLQATSSNTLNSLAAEFLKCNARLLILQADFNRLVYWKENIIQRAIRNSAQSSTQLDLQHHHSTKDVCAFDYRILYHYHQVDLAAAAAAAVDERILGALPSVLMLNDDVDDNKPKTPFESSQFICSNGRKCCKHEGWQSYWIRQVNGSLCTLSAQVDLECVKKQKCLEKIKHIQEICDLHISA